MHSPGQQRHRRQRQRRHHDSHQRLAGTVGQYQVAHRLHPHIDGQGGEADRDQALGQPVRFLLAARAAIMGTTADCCVSATVREANDRGYDCLVLTDCVADVSEARTASTLESFRINPLGATAERSALLAALR